MSKYDPNSITDGITLINRGVNSGQPPISLGRDQLAWAVNATSRDGYMHPRPGLVRHALVFESDNDDQEHFEDAIFEGATAFERRSQLVTMIGGRLFRIGLDRWDVLDVSTSDINPTNRYRAWFTEAEDYIIAQDGQSAPWLYDGASSVRSDTFGISGPKQVPVGEAMVYSQGRLIVALPDGRQFVIGDIVGGSSGSPLYNYRDAVLYFTENDVINGGGAFSVPINAGPLTAFRPVAQVDTSTGQGPTQVFTTGGIFSLNTPDDRTTWSTTNFPIGTVSMVSSGALSDRATVNVNGDIWMRSLDGVRSFIVARRDFTTWVNAPMSREVDRALDTDDLNLLGYASAALFDNRLLMTCNPYRVWGHGIVHRGLVAIDFANLAFLNTRTNPVWEGLWTGLQVLQIVQGTFKGIERCFIFALSSTNKIELWEVTHSDLRDTTVNGGVDIQWSMETCAMNFPRGVGAAPTIPGGELQQLGNGRLFVDGLSGDFAFTIFYRADQDPCWHQWDTGSACANNESCNTVNCEAPLSYREQYRKPFRLHAIQNVCDSETGKPANSGAEFQARLELTGQARIRRLELTAYDQQQNTTDSCEPTPATCQSVTCCPVNDFSYTLN